jgi:hypothetical protein
MALARCLYLPSLVIGTFGLGGCATWRAYELTPGPGVEQSLPYRLRATREDSARIALTSPFVRADTLYGRVHGDTVAVPLEEIVGLERERISLGRTIGAVIGIPAVALGVTYLILCGDGECQPTY